MYFISFKKTVLFLLFAHLSQCVLSQPDSATIKKILWEFDFNNPSFYLNTSNDLGKLPYNTAVNITNNNKIQYNYWYEQNLDSAKTYIVKYKKEYADKQSEKKTHVFQANLDKPHRTTIKYYDNKGKLYKTEREELFFADSIGKYSYYKEPTHIIHYYNDIPVYTDTFYYSGNGLKAEDILFFKKIKDSFKMHMDYPETLIKRTNLLGQREGMKVFGFSFNKYIQLFYYPSPPSMHFPQKLARRELYSTQLARSHTVDDVYKKAFGSEKKIIIPRDINKYSLIESIMLKQVQDIYLPANAYSNRFIYSKFGPGEYKGDFIEMNDLHEKTNEIVTRFFDYYKYIEILTQSGNWTVGEPTADYYAIEMMEMPDKKPKINVNEREKIKVYLEKGKVMRIETYNNKGWQYTETFKYNF